MSNIKISSDNRQSGKTVYNANIIQDIVALAVAEVEGTVPMDGKNAGIALYVEKDGVYADVSVVVKYGYNIPELAYRIQQSVKQNVENMTRYRVAEVDVHIQDISSLKTLCPLSLRKKKRKKSPRKKILPRRKKINKFDERPSEASEGFRRYIHGDSYEKCSERSGA